MPEINLPTKTTQDSIKADTQSILGKLPVSGGEKWENAQYAEGSHYSSGTVVSIAGKGILHGIIPLNGGMTPKLKLTLDGTILIDRALGTTSYIPFNKPFTNSLQLTFTTSGSSGSAGAVAIYSLN